MRRTLILAAAFVSACAAPNAAVGPQKVGPAAERQKVPDFENAAALKSEVAAGPAVEKQKISNLSYFDLAVCSPRRLDLPLPLNEQDLVGLLVAHRPEVMECLVDASTRGPAPRTAVTAELTVTEAGSKAKAAGPNLAPEGQACVEAALAKLDVPKLPKGALPVAGHADYQHVEVSPSVKMGVNEASDVAGLIRLAQTGWCDCYARWGDQPPRSLTLKLELGKDTPARATFEPTRDAASDGVAACLAEKVSAMKLPVKSTSLTLPYPFVFVHSGLDRDLAGEPPDVRFLQLDGLRGQRAADSALRVGARANAVREYDGWVAKYKASAKAVPLKQLRASCAGLVKSDDDWISALTLQVEVERQTATLTRELEARDPFWTPASVEAHQKLADGETDLAKARATRTADEAVCPKEHY